ncbi:MULTISPECIES: hypothetical protein [Rhodococcus]|uniref:Uncharacterized protein n=1 Tax=Rhodococcus oxybenzonivorans TaxID=1990687 RepID=A0AAE4UZX9_9NOCA|nr:MULTISPECIES: hypothetical protein [Rhodococcus]MDV7245329.1 hypothetical protein [Rhodococcus oxybenzonivorans]MDV7266098.1 hypothetical protein [Rhodococcus oxybenzonivorans]MDV7272391.1 hypothetical protein [Rhodococcus oxybenzonivorans]MDV7336354.1 hypothetical protein [Rhodococcus oxybenzonivorans]MDV7347654.1 hypothetical protein [Rhodococcus oxybenzonivorans]
MQNALVDVPGVAGRGLIEADGTVQLGDKAARFLEAVESLSVDSRWPETF